MILLDTADHLSFFQKIVQLDFWLLVKINRVWTNSFFDHVLPFICEAEIWIPFYLFLLVYSLINYSKKGLWWCMSLAMTGVISDLFSSSLIKPLVGRLRPCQDSEISPYIRLIAKYCPQNFSFVSSHACNHFSAAMFIFITMKQTSKWWAFVFIWAFAISYSQIYVGVHFPLDVLAGMIVGSVIGYAMSIFFNKNFGKLPTFNKSV